MKFILKYSKYNLLFSASLGLILIPIAIYYYTVYHFAINIPFWDEYYAALDWVGIYITKEFPENLLHTFKQANEHRIFTYYVTVLTEYILLGKVNFRYLMIFGNMAMLGLLYVLLKLRNERSNNLFAFLPVVLLLFAPQQEITNWGIMTYNGILEYFLVFASLLFLNKEGKLNLSIAVFFAAVATFSFGNGMFVFIAGFIILYLKKPNPKVKISIWAAFMLICVYLYFIDYLTIDSGFSKLEILHQPLQGLLFFLTIFGSLFTPWARGIIELHYLYGFILLSCFVCLILFKWKYLIKNPLFLSLFTFLFLSAFAATLSRVGVGVGAATAPRYVILPALFSALMYITYLNSINGTRKGVFFMIIALSVLLYVTRLNESLIRFDNHKNKLTEGLFSYYTNRDSTTLQYQYPNQAATILDNAIKGGYFTPPKISQLNLKVGLLENISLIADSNDILYRIDKKEDQPLFFQMKGWTILKENNNSNQQIVVILKSETKSYVFSTQTLSRMDVLAHFKDSYPSVNESEYCGFNFILDKNGYSILPQTYRVGIGITFEGEMKAIKFSSIYVDFK